MVQRLYRWQIVERTLSSIYMFECSLSALAALCLEDIATVVSLMKPVEELTMPLGIS
jgi:hypothetical protein